MTPLLGTPVHPVSDLPEGWASRPAVSSDVAKMTGLRRKYEEQIRGWASASETQIAVAVDDSGRVRREHLVIFDADGQLRGWCEAHDRAPGRVVVLIVVDPDLPDDIAQVVGDVLLQFARGMAVAMATDNDVAKTQLDVDVYSADKRQTGWLARAGLQCMRTWWHMSRAVRPEEKTGDRAPRDRVRIRAVGRGADGMPNVGDLRSIHGVLEEAFSDHFNSHEETFDAFVARLREDPNHHWDHWWIAEIIDGVSPTPAGALVGSVIPGPDPAEDTPPVGTYVEYIGVLRSARGHGVATSLMDTVITDAAQRDRQEVALEVDANSPTGAQGLYESLGFVTKYTTESWQLYLGTSAADKR